MSAPVGQSAVEACRRYEHECAKVARLTKEISDALSECPTLDPQNVFDMTIQGQWTHLRALYKACHWIHPDDCRGMFHYEIEHIPSGAKIIAEIECGEWEIIGYDGDMPADMACPHCLKAHWAVQARKEARQRLGAAKRLVRHAGKRASQSADQREAV